MTSYQLVFRKSYHLLLELENRAYWALKKLNLDLKQASEKRMLQLDELEELRLFSYENVKIFEEKTKRWHDRRNSNLDGWGYSSSIKFIHMEWSNYKTIREVHLRLMVNVSNIIRTVRLSKFKLRSI
ncbi:Pol polyprotein [Gossypium australe]|uniref:Pol polyprotein n=1 Tax=Gossypium australe TaxID=47621 RepID=A0A5B6WEZ7_9ROSI|nr:Pol polyprotein [Gossypium australe]